MVPFRPRAAVGAIAILPSGKWQYVTLFFVWTCGRFADRPILYFSWRSGKVQRVVEPVKPAADAATVLQLSIVKFVLFDYRIAVVQEEARKSEPEFPKGSACNGPALSATEAGTRQALPVQISDGELHLSSA